MGFNGKILKKIREQKGVTQMQLCHAINLNQSLFSKYETGIVKDPSAKRIKQFADYLDVPYESFFAKIEEDEPVLINQTSGIPERIDVHVHVKIDWGLG
jgi:transcriptional regulator with XRE-family HTH domain